MKQFEKVELTLYPGESFISLTLETAGFLIDHLTKLLPDESVQDWIDFIRINVEANVFLDDDDEEEWDDEYDSGSLYD